MSYWNKKKNRKYILESSGPPNECAIRDCHAPKSTLPGRFSFCGQHRYRIMGDDYRKPEERAADLLMEDKK